jgi:ABC-type microcin C transport system permease subunit YejB
MIPVAVAILTLLLSTFTRVPVGPVERHHANLPCYESALGTCRRNAP